MASSYQGYARPTGFQELTATNAELVRQQEQDNRKIQALEKQKAELDKRADKSERQLERKLTKEEEQRLKNYNFVENISYDNRVQAIKTNQQIEEQSYRTLAEEDRKKAQDLMQFSQSLTDSLGKFHEKWKNNQMQAGYNAAAMEGLPSDSVADQVEGSNKLYEQHLDIQDIGEALWKQGAPVNVVNNVKRSSAWWEYGAAQYRAEAAGDAFSFWIKNYVRDSGAIQPHEVQEALEKGREKFLKMNNLYGYSSDFLNPTLKKMGDASRRLLAKAQAGKDYVDSQDMVAVLRNQFYQNKDVESMNRYFADGMKSFDKNGVRYKGLFKEILKEDLSNTDIFSDEVFESLINSPTTDQPSKTWAERHPIWYDQIVEARKEDARTRFAKREAEHEFEGQQWLKKLKDDEDLLFAQGKRYSRDQQKEFIRQWKDNKWGPIPPHLTNMVTTEEVSDEDINERLERKDRGGEPIYKEDLYGIDDYELWKEWADIAKDSQNYSLPAEYKEELTSAINAAVKDYAKDLQKQEDYTFIDANTTNMKRDFIRLYKEHIVVSESPRKAYNAASNEMRENLKKGDYSRYAESSDNTVFVQNREIAMTAIKANPEIFYTSVVPGTEEALKKYRDTNGREVHKIFEDLAVELNRSKKINVTPTQLADFGLEVIDDKPIKTEADQELEKLPLRIQKLLSVHTDKVRVERAKVEWLRDQNANVSYNDPGFLSDDLQKLIEESREKVLDDKLKEAGYVTPQLNEARPRIGDWKRLPRGTFIKWDGDQWIETGVFFTNRKEYEFPAREYLDRDRVRRKLLR